MKRRTAALLAAHLTCMGAAAPPAPAMQILDAADHAELAAEIPARDVSRIALAGDRIARVVRSPDGFAAEHDPRSGDLYLRPVPPYPVAAASPVTLFIGTERGFTYRLVLTPSDRAPAQILIRNPDAGAVSAVKDRAGDPRIAALVRLIRAVAGREPLPGHSIVPGDGASIGGLPLVETWRGPRFAAHVLEAGRHAPEAPDLAGTMSAAMGGARAAAVWIAAPGTGASGGRIAVAVTESVSGRAHPEDAR